MEKSPWRLDKEVTYGGVDLAYVARKWQCGIRERILILAEDIGKYIPGGRGHDKKSADNK